VSKVRGCWLIKTAINCGIFQKKMFGEEDRRRGVAGVGRRCWRLS
jgi:hypothetical protein